MLIVAKKIACRDLGIDFKTLNRWGKRNTRNWEQIEEVSLNYLQNKRMDAMLTAS